MVDVIFTSQFANLYGASQSLGLLIEGLDDRGWDVGLVVDRDGPLLKKIESRGVPTEVVERDASSDGGFVSRLTDNTSYVTRLLSVIRKFDPDVVYVNNTQPAAILAGRISGRPTIYHAREPGTVGDTVWGRIRGKICRSLPDRIIAVSESVKETLGEEGAPPPKIEVVWNGTALPVLGGQERTKKHSAQASYPLADDSAIVLGSAGRIAPDKGIDVLLRGFAEAQRASEINLCLLVAGDAEDQAYLDGICSLTEDLGVEERVAFIGFEEDIDRFYSALDVYLTTPTYEEPFGRTVIEAMAHGKPVVASCVGGIPELIDDGLTGYLVSPQDVDELAQAILSFTGELGQARKMGKRARMEAEERFSVDRYVSEIVQILSQFWSQKGS